MTREQVASRPRFPVKSLCEIWGSADTSQGHVHSHSPSAPSGRSACILHPSHSVEEPQPARAQAVTLPSLLSAGDAIPTKKPSPPPGSFGHRYKKFSFEGTTGLPVLLLGHSSLGRGVALAALTGPSRCVYQTRSRHPVPLI